MTKLTKPCAICGTLFSKSARLSHIQWAARKFCSQTCSGASNKAEMDANRAPLRERFEARFSQTGSCWEWNGTIDGYGYGVIDHAGHRYRAHVLALEYAGRPVKKGEIACHHCDNPRCVRPDHLYPGSPADNARDASLRMRLLVGEEHHQAKLTEHDVREIRSSSLTNTEAAKRFGVTRQNIRRIRDGLIWRSVT